MEMDVLPLRTEADDDRALAHLVGFRKTDELVGEQHELPEDLLKFAKGLAKVRKNDPDAVFPYPLQPAVARKLAAAMGVAIDPEHHNYFL
jgi:hypothetical protein